MENKDIITLARELGAAMQKSDEYIRFSIARQAADEDETLQKLITDFNLVRVEASSESAKADGERDDELVRQKNAEMRKLYGTIMSNEHMIGYNDAKDEIDGILNRVIAIISQSADGEDPETTDYYPSSCSGQCSSCGGCG